jgi:DNA polymerase-3 subunit epsilon
MAGRKPTGRRFHRYLNPERQVEAGALAVHGLSNEFLQDKPRFREVVDEFLEFVRDAELIIHNAPFDLGFLDNELSLLSRPPLQDLTCNVLDTLRMAKDLHPGRRNSLDALCERYGVSNTQRTLHGALLDAQLLAEVYLAMTRGQESLIMDLDPSGNEEAVIAEAGQRPALRVLAASAEELAAHEQVLDDIARDSKGACVWRAAP